MKFSKPPSTITLRDMLLSWAVAEIDSKIPNSLGSMFAANPRAVAKTIAGALSDEQEAAVIGALLYARSGVLGYLFRRPLTWYRGSVRLADLPDLKTMGYLAEAAPSRKMGELARTPVKPLLREIPKFQPRDMRGSLIAVSDKLYGDWCLVEGKSRCREMILLMDRGGVHEDTETDIILGVHEEIAHWSNW